MFNRKIGCNLNFKQAMPFIETRERYQRETRERVERDQKDYREMSKRQDFERASMRGDMELFRQTNYKLT